MKFATIVAIIVCALSVPVIDAQKPKPKTRIERQKENDEAFAKLTYAQQRWVVYSAKKTIESGVGWMGAKDWSRWAVRYVESPTEVVMHYSAGPWGLFEEYGWVSGVDTSRLVTNGSLDTGKEVFWIPRTKKYSYITMHEYERIPYAELIVRHITPPKGAKLEDYPPK